MSGMQHVSEERLIEYQMHEVSDLEAKGIRRHLEACGACAALSEAIAETLRVYSAEAVPEMDEERQWARLRPQLPLKTLAPVGGRGWFSGSWWPVAGLVAAMLAVVLYVGAWPRLRNGFQPDRRVDDSALRAVGPLTATPRDPEIGQQLDNAERLLTEVNHSSGAIDGATRSEAHELLLKNAVYIQSAREQGDLGTASVLENLGRVLTSIDHAPESKDSGFKLRLEWNTQGLLLDVRILRQNDAGQ
jgi:hypothetical protein